MKVVNYKDWIKDGASINGEYCIIFSNGARCWFKNGIRHRLDGPSCMYISINIEWWVNGVQFRNNTSYQNAAGISDEEMLVIIIKYGNVK